MVEVGIGEIGGFLEGEAIDALLQHSLNVGWEFAYEHFFFHIVKIDVLGLFFECSDILGGSSAVTLETIEDDGGLLLFGNAVFGAEVRDEFGPFRFGGVAPEKFIDSGVKVDGKLGFEECEFFAGSVAKGAYKSVFCAPDPVVDILLVEGGDFWFPLDGVGDLRGGSGGFITHFSA